MCVGKRKVNIVQYLRNEGVVPTHYPISYIPHLRGQSLKTLTIPYIWWFTVRENKDMLSLYWICYLYFQNIKGLWFVFLYDYNWKNNFYLLLIRSTPYVYHHEKANEQTREYEISDMWSWPTTPSSPKTLPHCNFFGQTLKTLTMISH